MARVAGRSGRLYVNLTSGGTAEPVNYLNQWSINFATDNIEVTDEAALVKDMATRFERELIEQLRVVLPEAVLLQNDLYGAFRALFLDGINYALHAQSVVLQLDTSDGGCAVFWERKALALGRLPAEHDLFSQTLRQFSNNIGPFCFSAVLRNLLDALLFECVQYRSINIAWDNRCGKFRY